ncbi:MAG: dCTP deaminase [Patescibacteria group bacterium]|nr:dCTP deaminase [Patescibacteria group bacterium]
MILSDHDIKEAIKQGHIKIKGCPDYEECIHCASLDFHLANIFKVFKHSKFPLIDTRDPKLSISEMMDTIEIKDGDPYFVQPGEFVLGATVEHITLPNDIVARVEGRSSFGRLGLIIHATAGFVDPGFSGTITLEISNLSPIPIAIYPGTRIGQFAFNQMSSPADISYGDKSDSKYLDQIKPTESQIMKDREVKNK